MAMRPSVKFILYATPSKEQTDDIITFSQFGEGGLFAETRENAESGDQSDDYSMIPPLLSKEEIYVMVQVMSQMVDLCLWRC